MADAGTARGGVLVALREGERSAQAAEDAALLFRRGLCSGSGGGGGGALLLLLLLRVPPPTVLYCERGPVDKRSLVLEDVLCLLAARRRLQHEHSPTLLMKLPARRVGAEALLDFDCRLLPLVLLQAQARHISSNLFGGGKAGGWREARRTWSGGHARVLSPRPTPRTSVGSIEPTLEKKLPMRAERLPMFFVKSSPTLPRSSPALGAPPPGPLITLSPVRSGIDPLAPGPRGVAASVRGVETGCWPGRVASMALRAFSSSISRYFSMLAS